MSSIYYINTTEIPNYCSFAAERRDLSCNHSNVDVITCEDKMLFSHVKMSCFRALHCIGVYIIIVFTLS